MPLVAAPHCVCRRATGDYRQADGVFLSYKGVLQGAMAYIAMAYMFMAYIFMACIVVVYIVTGYIVMAYIIMMPV